MNFYFKPIIKFFRESWLSVLVVMIALATTFLSWQSFRAQENANIQGTVNVEAQSLQHGVEVEMRERVLALQRMADRWAAQPDGTSRAAWNADSENYYNDFKGFQAVEWADETYTVRWVTPSEGNEAAVNLDLTNQPGWRDIFDQAREDGKAVILHRPKLVQGGRGVVAFCPIGKGENFKGLIVGVFRVEKLFQMMLNPEIAPNYDISVWEGEKLIYQNGERTDFAGDAFVAAQTISFTNAQWQMEISPRPQRLAKLYSKSDQIALFTGSIFSMLLGLAVFYAQRARRQSRDLRVQISARQKAQSDQKRLTAILEVSEDFIGIIHADGTPIYTNRAGRKMIGIEEAADITATSIYDIYPEWVLDVIKKEAIPTAVREGSWLGETAFIGADSGEIFVSQMILTHKDENGEIEYISTVARDITVQKEAQQALKKSEYLYRQLTDKSQGLICTHDLEGNLLTVNESAAAALGYKTYELIGKNIDSIISPKFRSRFQSYLENITSISKTSGLMYIVARDGSERVWQFSNTLDDDNGKPFVLGYAQDITELIATQKALRESERRNRNLLECSPIGIVLTDAAGGVLFVNERWCKMTGLNLDQAKGEGWANAIHPEDREKILNEWIQKSKLEEETTYEFRFLNGHNKTIEVIARAIKQYDENGEFSGHLATVADISEIKELQAELKETRDVAIESARLKSEFLANMSHEIRTPMNGVIGMTDLLLDTNLDIEQFEYTETIKTSADALLNVINDILDFSKIEAGKMSFETIEFDLLNPVENVVELFAEQTQRKQLELSSLVESDVPLALLGDPGRLRQILTNLIGNAIKFTERGEVSVRVSKLSETDDRVRLKFSVKDSGIGISEDAQSYLFRAFTQADGSTTRKYGGTGLGLAITKQLVEMMGGEINIASKLGKGSEFWFTIELEKQKLESQIKEVSKLADLEDLRVLIVDDNPTNRKVLSYQTKSWGMLPREAENGIIALEMLKAAAENNKPFDLAILDLMMPIISGFDLAKFIKNESSLKNLRLIIMPSYGQRGDGKKASDLGINGYLIKPVKQANLFDCIATVMGETVYITAQDEEIAKKEFVTKHSMNEDKLRSRQRILLAEDNEINQRVTRQQLEKVGYQVDVVANGNQALTAIARQDYALILMDCQMPVMDGYTATAEIRRREGNGGNRTPVVALTAHAIEGEREKCLLAGMDDYISKPVKKDFLIETIERNIKMFSGINNSIDETDLGEVNAEENQLFDLATLEEITDYDSEMMREMIELYTEQIDERIKEISDALEKEDFDEIYRLAHTCKGSSATLGMTLLIEPFTILEEAGKTSDLEQSKQIAAQLKTMYPRLKKQLEELLTSTLTK